MPRPLSEKYFQKFKQIKKDILGDDVRAKRKAVTALHNRGIYRFVDEGKSIIELFFVALQDADKGVRIRAAKALSSTSLFLHPDDLHKSVYPKKFRQECSQAMVANLSLSAAALRDQEKDVRWEMAWYLDHLRRNHGADILLAVPFLFELLANKTDVHSPAGRVLENFIQTKKQAEFVWKNMRRAGFFLDEPKDGEIKRLVARIKSFLSGQAQELQKTRRLSQATESTLQKNLTDLKRQIKSSDSYLQMAATRALLQFEAGRQVIEEMLLRSKTNPDFNYYIISAIGAEAFSPQRAEKIKGVIPILLALYPLTRAATQREIGVTVGNFIEHGVNLQPYFAQQKIFSETTRMIQQKIWGKIKNLGGKNQWLESLFRLAALESAAQKGVDLSVLLADKNFCKKVKSLSLWRGKNLFPSLGGVF